MGKTYKDSKESKRANFAKQKESGKKRIEPYNKAKLRKNNKVKDV
jgi:hypothetical protein